MRTQTMRQEWVKTDIAERIASAFVHVLIALTFAVLAAGVVSKGEPICDPVTQK